MLEIDGSRGGGQILRTSLSLSAITGKAFRMKNIRGNRKSSGLKTQHLKGVNSTGRLCNAEVKGNKLGSKQIEFIPKEIRHKPLEVKIETAGSIGLLFQTLQLPASQAGEPLEINIEGGSTFSKWAPTLPFLQHVFLPIAEKTGYKANIEVEKHGYYPRGGSSVKIIVKPCKTFKPVKLLDRGELKEIKGLSIASKHLEKPNVAKRQAKSAENHLKKEGYRSEIKYKYVEADNPGSGIALWSVYENTILGSDSIGERGKPSEKVGEKAANSLLNSINSQACLDKYMADQILNYLAVAAENGKSRISVERITEHCKTNIQVIKKFLSVEFKIKENLIEIKKKG